ncbi:DUF1904 domain-containing protein [Vibrio sp. ZSDZ34]|uniref:DUF1904 domain-containing protein n=1 Tax=Vibrio gelatinilyticus TaxID=2893468 RepID=A0A9X1WFI4_9VIBR|nr:DUF1904 family protein [Vibrio gelatinilyticus]MCJ2378515.1 DUF1904 domain-containing protein [Vibrio gelatinilyticus]
MLHLRFRAVDTEVMSALSIALVAELQQLFPTSSLEDFTFELVSTQFYKQGDIYHGSPFVEVLYANVTPVVQDKLAEVITHNVQLAAGQDIDVTVIFTEFHPGVCYLNGKKH